MHLHQSLHSERNLHPKTVLQHSPTHHLSSTTPTTRTHSLSSSSISSVSSAMPHYSFSSTTNTPTTHSNAITNHSLSSQSVIPSKYDFGHSTTAGSIHSSQPSSASSLTSNLSANSNYMHAANNLQSQLSYSNVKSESNVTSNYDYMNSCLQNGYFNSSYGTAISGSPATASHPVSDLTSYHHIQAAKLMATS